jgi:murein DD-endopeptidase MepM/ murein hydrolase activator NlpD
MFPLKNYPYQIPEKDDLGAFGVKRKHDIHTGVDLYCKEGETVYAIEDGIVIAIEPFTGEIAGFPWWNDTYAMAIQGASGIINYGEIQPLLDVKVGDAISEGAVLGHVIPVLKKDKGKVPSTSMLHLELYNEYTGNWIEWALDKDKPVNIQDPTTLLKEEFKKSFYI